MGALHQADFTTLRIAASAWHDALATLPKPLLVVNVGGPTSNLFCIEEFVLHCLLYLFEMLPFKFYCCSNCRKMILTSAHAPNDCIIMITSVLAGPDNGPKRSHVSRSMEFINRRY